MPDGIPVAFVTGDDQDPAEIVWQAYKIGYELLAGRLAGGMDAWLAAGNPEATTAFAPADEAPAGPYLDVRQEAEYAVGHVPARCI